MYRDCLYVFVISQACFRLDEGHFELDQRRSEFRAAFWIVPLLAFLFAWFCFNSTASLRGLGALFPVPAQLHSPVLLLMMRLSRL